MIEIRPEGERDADGITAVHTAAFPTPLEAVLVTLLRQRGKSRISLVAELDSRIVGHVLFSPVDLETEDARLEGLGLAPLAVLPEYQCQGVGSRLTEAGIAACRQLDAGFVVVLGEP